VDDAQPGAGRAGRPDPVLYPDIARLGSLQDALQAELDQASHRLTVLPERAPGWRDVGARVEDLNRSTSIVMGIQERAFIMEFWSAGVCMARGTTQDLPAAAGATHLWQSGARVRELNVAWPFVRFGGLAEAHERGEAAEYTWQHYHQNPRQAPHMVRLHAFIALAIHEPRLRELLPFTSRGTLGFSKTPGYPYSGGYPWVTPVGVDRYLVTGPDGGELGTADAAGGLALVLAALPSTETAGRGRT
jgi:hypothetical protein